MAALINKVEFAVGNELLKLMTDKWRGDSVIISPHEQSRLLDLAKLISQVIANSAFCKRNDFYRFKALVYNPIHFIHQLFCGGPWIVKGQFCFLFDVLIISAFWIGVPHSILKQTRTSGQNDRSDGLRMFQHMKQCDMTA